MTSLLRADARALPLADATVDLVVTSPPYWALRSYTDGGEHYAGQIGSELTPASYIETLIEVTRECMRVLKSSGSIWVNLGDKYAQATERSRNGLSSGLDGGKPLRDATDTVTRPRQSNGVPQKSLIGLPWRYALRCIDDLGLILRAEVIWSKPNGLPESVTDRVRRTHETWFHLTKGARYYAAVDAVRQAYDAPRAIRTMGEVDRSRGDWGKAAQRRNAVDTMNPLGKLPGSVWEIPTAPLIVPDHLGVDHFAAFPMEWPRRIIRGWSPAGGTVLDPFGGTGTTALVAEALGRRGVSVDMSADYQRIAAWRTSDPGQRAKALGVPKPPPQADGQLSLLGEEGAA